jgi:hypothetical protein
MPFIADRIQRHLDREIDAIESDENLTPAERAREIHQLEREARWQYEEERARIIDDNDRDGW